MNRPVVATSACLRRRDLDELPNPTDTLVDGTEGHKANVHDAEGLTIGIDGDSDGVPLADSYRMGDPAVSLLEEFVPLHVDEEQKARRSPSSSPGTETTWLGTKE